MEGAGEESVNLLEGIGEVVNGNEGSEISEEESEKETQIEKGEEGKQIYRHPVALRTRRSSRMAREERFKGQKEGRRDFKGQKEGRRDFKGQKEGRQKE